MRVQASLIINDTELYENIVKPRKETREFNYFLVQLLQAYKEDYNGLRSYFGEDTDYMAGETKDYSDIYGSVIESIAVMDTLLTDGENMLGGAIDSFSDCIDKAKEQGIIRETETKNGAKGVELALEVVKRPEEHAEKPQEQGDLGLILNEIRNLSEKVNNISSDVEKLKRQSSGISSFTPEIEEKVEVEVETPVMADEPKAEPVFFIADEEDDFAVADEPQEEVTFEAEKEDEQDSKAGEASEAMSGLLASLWS